MGLWSVLRHGKVHENVWNPFSKVLLESSWSYCDFYDLPYHRAWGSTSSWVLDFHWGWYVQYPQNPRDSLTWIGHPSELDPNCLPACYEQFWTSILSHSLDWYLLSSQIHLLISACLGTHSYTWALVGGLWMCASITLCSCHWSGLFNCCPYIWWWQNLKFKAWSVGGYKDHSNTARKSSTKSNGLLWPLFLPYWPRNMPAKKPSEAHKLHYPKCDSPIW